MFTSITSYSTHIHVLWAKELCSVILWYHLWCLLPSWPHIVILWATIATHLLAKMKENGWKQVFDDTYLHNLLFYTQICSIGQWVMFNYPMVSPKVPTTLMTPYSCPMGHHSHSFVTKNGQKLLKNMFLEMFTSITSYSTYIHVLWAKEWCSVIPWYHLWCLLHSWPHIVILWATIATHLWAKSLGGSR